MRKRFYPHQHRMMRYAMSEAHPALFVEMRLGKTLVTLRRCALYSPRNRALGLRVLVVAPNSALGSWAHEGEGEDWRVFWLTGVKRARTQQLEDTMTIAEQPTRAICLINKEGWRALRIIRLCPWDAVIVDESPFLKNPKAAVTKFFLKHFRAVPHRWVLTGTPCPEGEEEYFCQLAFLRGGAFGFKSFWAFRQHYMEPDPFGSGAWLLKPGAADHIRRVVGGTCCVMRRRDVGMDKTKVYERREVEMDAETRKRYDKAENELVLSIPGEEDRSTKWITVAWSWLRQMCGGFVDGKLVWDGKIRELLELIDGELRREQVVVWCAFNAEITAIVNALRVKRITCSWWNGNIRPAIREVTRQGFQSGRFRVLVVQEATAQTGMDLSAAGTSIYYSTPVGQMSRMQTEARILSLGKNGPLLYIDLVTKDSVDEDVMKILSEKKAMSDLSLSRALAAAMRTRKGWTT